uniref:Glycosyl transferase CAP10 domain-containing protein n=1 Tax=Glycine max TaxID=3847 RepID=A0A0R0G2A6_SOYBN
MFSGASSSKSAQSTTSPFAVSIRKPIAPLNCTAYNLTGTCPTNLQDHQRSPATATCPDYFLNFITSANLRFIILKGRAYLETYSRPYQTRDVFSIWGILQLLRRYPGKIPDLELMFDCVDWPVQPPPLFRYCGNDATLDVVFLDWSFWGWAEINIKPWHILLGELKEGTTRIPWLNREPYAYWKDWNARLLAQDWLRESQEGFNKSDLPSQCTYRYKVYIEGSAWSVSQKYILSCDSTTLLVKPKYYDFFTRGLIPVHHYWPIKDDDKCRSIKFAVDWGNNHKQRAHQIGKVAFKKRYKPSISANATELCVESMVCGAEGSVKKFMMESLVKVPANTDPCTMPAPFDPPTLYATLQRKESSIQQVESWEKSCWDNQTITS